MSERPWLYVVAGPNGAGKSTLAQMLLPVFPVVNPDDIARTINPQAPEASAFTAGREALKHVRDHLDARRSFGVETTLAGRWIFRVMRQAGLSGFRVMVLYVGIAPENLAIRRVAERARSGGHNVPVEDIRRRYRISLAHLAEAVASANQAVLYDNSAGPEIGPRVFAEVEEGVFVALETDRPPWFSIALGGTGIGMNLRS
ncbi:MAG TPA: AAA family ATPase [Longimicrobium sp.]|jgi:predicted ABC-type ATPase